MVALLEGMWLPNARVQLQSREAGSLNAVGESRGFDSCSNPLDRSTPERIQQLRWCVEAKLVRQPLNLITLRKLGVHGERV